MAIPTVWTASSDAYLSYLSTLWLCHSPYTYQSSGARGDSEPRWGSETVGKGAPLRTGACPGVVEDGTVLVWSIPCSVHTYHTSFSQHFSQNRRVCPSPGRSDAFRKPFPASTRQSLPMVASPGPGVVRGGEWLQYRARVVVIYMSTAPVRRFRRALRDPYR